MTKGHEHMWANTNRREIVVCKLCGLPAIRDENYITPVRDTKLAKFGNCPRCGFAGCNCVS